MNLTPIVLLLSDDPESTALRELHFREKNCAVVTETSPHHAVAAARSLSPSLLILDLELPHLERLSLCRELRATTSSPIILLSSVRDEQKIFDYYLAGVNEHCRTPLPPIVLLVKSMAWLMREDWTQTASEPNLGYTLNDPAPPQG